MSIHQFPIKPTSFAFNIDRTFISRSFIYNRGKNKKFMRGAGQVFNVQAFLRMLENLLRAYEGNWWCGRGAEAHIRPAVLALCLFLLRIACFLLSLFSFYIFFIVSPTKKNHQLTKKCGLLPTLVHSIASVFAWPSSCLRSVAVRHIQRPFEAIVIEVCYICGKTSAFDLLCWLTIPDNTASFQPYGASDMAEVTEQFC